jgi:phosphopantothenate-cysteine ligase/phosphopantothenoylcysteine decarboxylase/phosphopantothenate--cysteine ligase
MPMRVLVTAGNTQAPLDRVRCVTNIFTGRTGGQIAAAAAGRGHAVTLLTPHPEAVAPPAAGWRARTYRTFDDLAALMAAEVAGGAYDAVIHSAAVSDYLVAGVFARGPDGGMADAASGKMQSTHPELWVKMTPAPKLVDRVRTDWRFRGVLVKFKLEVGPTESELLPIAERSRVHSGADLMCTNTLDGMHDWAVIGAGPGGYERVRRADLADRLLDAVELIYRGRA